MSDMKLPLAFLVICFMVIPGRSAQEDDGHLRFPEGFAIGASTSAYQSEGGWNASDKGESVWDRFTHTQPWNIAEGSTGDIACDSYHKYKEDVRMVREIGLDHYRFSISWPRLLPNGSATFISQDGLRFYHNLIDELLANQIEPIVTLYHWDHPQVLEDMGGWLNESMVDWFTDYANVVFREFGPKVKIFTTINEAEVLCFMAYQYGQFAPGETLIENAPCLCHHNSLKAHAKAYHLYDREYRPTQNGKIGIAAMCDTHYPKHPQDTLAAEMGFQFSCGRTLHPIFIGDYPEILKVKIAEMSRAAGLAKSALPEFSPEWIEYIRGTSDYLGLNHYKTFLVELGPPSNISKAQGFPQNSGLSTSFDPSWEKSAMSGMAHIVPEAFGDLLRNIKSKYNNPPVYVLENGMSTDEGILNDHKRIKYHHSYMKELLLAVNRDGCNVQKYTFWSLTDDFEWIFGYEAPFGLIHVNFSSPNLERVQKLSASWLNNVIRTRQLQPPILPPTNSTLHK